MTKCYIRAYGDEILLESNIVRKSCHALRYHSSLAPGALAFTEQSCLGGLELTLNQTSWKPRNRRYGRLYGFDLS